jgi:hypothetical protein
VRALERGVLVRVVAATLSNGAPHPMLGRTGVVLEVRAKVPYPVRVHLDGQPGRPGRTVMLAAAELERVILAVRDDEPAPAADGVELLPAHDDEPAPHVHTERPVPV